MLPGAIAGTAVKTRRSRGQASEGALKPDYSGRFASHQMRYSARMLKPRHGAWSRTSLFQSDVVRVRGYFGCSFPKSDSASSRRASSGSLAGWYFSIHPMA